MSSMSIRDLLPCDRKFRCDKLLTVPSQRDVFCRQYPPLCLPMSSRFYGAKWQYVRSVPCWNIQARDRPGRLFRMSAGNRQRAHRRSAQCNMYRLSTGFREQPHRSGPVSPVPRRLLPGSNRRAELLVLSGKLKLVVGIDSPPRLHVRAWFYWCIFQQQPLPTAGVAMRTVRTWQVQTNRRL